MIQIACIGGANRDWKAKGIRHLEHGTSNPAKIQSTHGGVARNIVENLARLRLKTALCARVGQDVEGDQIVQYLKSLGVDVDGVSRSETQATAKYLGFFQPDGELELALSDGSIHEELAGSLLEKELKRLEPAKIWVLDTNLSPSALERVARLKPEQTELWAVPVSAPKVGRLNLILPKLTGLILNLAELNELTRAGVGSGESIETRCRWILKHGVQYLFVTDGARGVYFTSKDGFYLNTIEKSEMHVDVTGAGDAFAAGVIYGTYIGEGWETCLLIGMKLAQLTLATEASVAPVLSPEMITGLLSPS